MSTEKVSIVQEQHHFNVSTEMGTTYKLCDDINIIGKYKCTDKFSKKGIFERVTGKGK